MRLEDSLGHAKNSDTNVAIVSQTSCPPFWLSLKTYFFELLLDRWSDLNQNLIISSSDHADKNLRHDAKMTLEAVSLKCFGILTPNLVCAIVNSHRTHHIDLIIAPPIGQTW